MLCPNRPSSCGSSLALRHRSGLSLAAVPGLLPPCSGQLVRGERWIMTRSNLIGSCSNARRRCFDVNCLLYDFSMQREVEALAFDILRHAQPDEHLDHEQDDQADHGIIDEYGGDADALVEELSNVALQHARGSAILLDREHPRQQRADDAANRMDAEAIQRIVIAEHALQPGASPVADGAGGHADGKGADGSDETGSRR